MKLIKGLAGSPGKITGKARVIKSLDDVDKFKPGDILVTIATDPTWTPVMHMASAIVTDLGGTLCHAAIVSREYGIPAVVGTKKATELIKNNQTISVDGTKGTIKLITKS